MARGVTGRRLLRQSKNKEQQPDGMVLSGKPTKRGELSYERNRKSLQEQPGPDC